MPIFSDPSLNKTKAGPGTGTGAPKASQLQRSKLSRARFRKMNLKPHHMLQIKLCSHQSFTQDFLDTPVVPFYPFYLGVSLLKQNSRKKGTLIIQGLLGNLVFTFGLSEW